MRRALPAMLLAAAAVTAQEPPPAWRWLATEDLGCLTPPATLADVGLSGTDLGVSFARDDRLVFLFGDSWTLDRRDWDHDAVATTRTAPLGDKLPRLRFETREGGRFATLAPKDQVQGAMDVPVEGLVVGRRTYVFFSSGYQQRTRTHSHSLLAHSDEDELATLTLDHRVPSTKFVNVSLVEDGDVVWIFGSGPYRHSAVFLARVEAARLADRDAWRYWPDFAAGEESAKPLVASDQVGELSVRRMPGSGRLAMTYNAKEPRGIHLRTAEEPTGPWSAPVVIFDPRRDSGYGVHMHQKVSAVGYDDGLSMPGREEEWGGEYGPYLVPQWCEQPAPGALSLVYTLSTWNPYTVRLVRSVVAAPDADYALPAREPRPPAPGRAPKNLSFEGGELTGWKQDGDAFGTFRHADGTFAVVTYVQPRGDAIEGRLWQEFVVPANARELRGVVTGGHQEVQLWCDDRLVYRTAGRRSNDTDVPLRYRLDALRGREVRLQIVDASTQPWGFVCVRGLEIVE